MTLDEIQKALEPLRPEVVAAETGLSISTIYKYRDGRAKNPPLETVRKLSDYLTERLERRP